MRIKRIASLVACEIIHVLVIIIGFYINTFKHNGHKRISQMAQIINKQYFPIVTFVFPL